MMGLAVHPLSKSAVASLAIATKLVHVVVVGRVIVRVVVRVVARVAGLSMRLLHMLSLLRSRPGRVLSTQCGVRRGVPAVLSLVVTALRLLLFVR